LIDMSRRPFRLRLDDASVGARGDPSWKSSGAATPKTLAWPWKCDLAARDQQQVVEIGRELAQGLVLRGGVVVGDGDEIEAPRLAASSV